MTWGMVASAAIGVGTTALSGGFNKSNRKGGSGGVDISMLDTRNADQKAIDGAMSAFVTKYLPQFDPGKPYAGSLNAPMNTYQNQGMDFLQTFLDQSGQANSNPMLTMAGTELSKTLNGEYDPSTSDFYKTTRDAALVNQQTAQNQLNAGQGARGKFFSSEAMNENQQLQTNTTNFMNQTLAGLTEKERQNRLAAVPQAMALDKAGTAARIAPIAAATSFGAIPQQLDQAGLEREYNAWLNQRTEMAMPLQAATGAFQGGNSKTLTNTTQPAQSFDWGGFLGNATQNVDWGSLISKVGSWF